MSHRLLNFRPKSIIFNRKLIFVFVVCLIIIGAGVLILETSERCTTKTEERIVRGDSLSPLINPGDTVKILFDYYDCHKIKREDVVAYSYAGNENPIIKIVKGIPGDKFSLVKSSNDSDWNILINRQIVKNSQDQPYLIGQSGYRMLSLYERDYKGIIPENAYLLLGNKAFGSLDSTRFGLIDKSDILGKVKY